MGTNTLKKAGARAGGLGAALTLAGFLGIAGASAAPSPPQCEGPYDPGATCTTGTFSPGFYGSALACDRQGRYAVNNYTMDTRHGTVGWYTWACGSVNAGGDEMWQLTLYGYVYK